MTHRRTLVGCALLAALCVSVDARAQETVLLRRYADIVAVRERPEAPERVLYYFQPTIELPQGAQVQQGSSGFSELHLSGGAVLAPHAAAQLIVERLSGEGDIIRVPMLNLLEVVGGTRMLTLKLPAGTTCTLLESVLLIELIPGRLRIRNQKGADVVVSGLIGVSPRSAGGSADPEPGEGTLRLPAGQEILIPMYVGERSGGGMSTRAWVGRLVRYGAGATVNIDGARLVVGRSGDGELPETADVELGGVATMPGPGRLVVSDPRPAAAPPVIAVPPVAPPVAPPAAPAAAAPEPQESPAQAADESPPPAASGPDGRPPQPEEDSP